MSEKQISDKRNRRTAPPASRARSVRGNSRSLQRIKALLRNRPAFRDERLAPKVDHALLLKLARDDLPEGAARDVYRLIVSFKTWSDAYCDLVVREYRANEASSVNHF
jgi:hypothetical protein